jgi:hypothetical protein
MFNEQTSFHDSHRPSHPCTILVYRRFAIAMQLLSVPAEAFHYTYPINTKNGMLGS